MKNKKTKLEVWLKLQRKIGLLIIGLFLMNMANSQTASPELVSSSGDRFNNTSYQLDWSIGECITATHIAGSYVTTQGFHQNSYVITAVEDLRTDINIFVYPNPTMDFILVDLSTFVASERPASVLTITDINGKVLHQAKVTNAVEQLDLSNYTSGVYFLTVEQESQLIKSFKIIKN